jgi:hypothetical protein
MVNFEAIKLMKWRMHVAILGHGPSLLQYIWLAKGLGARAKLADEVWAINAVADVLACDRVFHMDDVAVQAIRGAANPDGNIAAMLPWLARHPGPIYTSIVRDGYPGMVAFPLEDVLTNLGYGYFNSTAAYAVAFAIHIGVRKISLFGCDFTYPNAHDAEKGRGCVEYWLGQAHARGIEILLPQRTSLLDAIEPEKFYGYDAVNISISEDTETGKITLGMTPRELPTAAEIESRYDHSKHPNSLVSGDAA